MIPLYVASRNPDKLFHHSVFSILFWSNSGKGSKRPKGPKIGKKKKKKIIIMWPSAPIRSRYRWWMYGKLQAEVTRSRKRNLSGSDSFSGHPASFSESKRIDLICRGFRVQQYCQGRGKQDDNQFALLSQFKVESVPSAFSFTSEGDGIGVRRITPMNGWWTQMKTKLTRM